MSNLTLPYPPSSRGLRVIRGITHSLPKGLCYNSGNQGKRKKAKPTETVAEVWARRHKPA